MNSTAIYFLLSKWLENFNISSVPTVNCAHFEAKHNVLVDALQYHDEICQNCGECDQICWRGVCHSPAENIKNLGNGRIWTEYCDKTKEILIFMNDTLG